MADKFKSSASLRATLRVAKLVGIKYDVEHFPYGGHFNTIEMEKIAEKIEKLKAQSSG